MWSRLFKFTWAQMSNSERARAAHRLALQSATDRDLWPRLNHLYLLHGQSRLGQGKEMEAGRPGFGDL